jgi:outer membrane protein TolC
VCAAALWSLLTAGYSQQAGGGMMLLDAIRSALENHTHIQIAKQQSEIARGAALSESGAFDTIFSTGVTRTHTYTPLTRLERLQDGGGAPFSQALNSTGTNIGVSRLFRNGISVRAVHQVDRNLDNLANIDGVSTSQLGVVFTVPLLQGRGRTVVDAAEIAAHIEVDASLFDISQTVAQQLAQTAVDYWNLVAALKNLKVANASESRGRTLLNNTWDLIEADVIPQNDMNSVSANLADRMARCITAQENVAAARAQLALDIGLRPEDIGAMQDPAEDFPAGESQIIPLSDSNAVASYLHEALRRRADLLAARSRRDEAEVRVRAARDLLKPRVDLTFSTGYSGLAEGRSVGTSLTSPFRGAQGADALGGVQFSLPLANRGPRGIVLQAEAAVRQNELRLEEVSRGISADVVKSVSDMQNSIVGLRSSRQSVESFEQALEGERQKLGLGLNSVIDVLTVEDRLTLALANRVEAQRRYAVSLVEFRLATGTIVSPSEPVQTVTRDVFVTFPPELKVVDRP